VSQIPVPVSGDSTATEDARSRRFAGLHLELETRRRTGDINVGMSIASDTTRPASTPLLPRYRRPALIALLAT